MARLALCEDCGIVEVRGRARLCRTCNQIRRAGRESERRAELRRHGLCPRCKAMLATRGKSLDGEEGEGPGA